MDNQCVGALWCDLLRFYSLSFKQDVHCVSIVNQKYVPKSNKGWSTKRLAIEGKRMLVNVTIVPVEWIMEIHI